MFLNEKERNILRILGIVTSILSLWNGVCDLIYGYSEDLNGRDHFSWKVVEVISSGGNRSHWMIMIAQTAGWLYPIYGLTYYHWFVGMKKAGWFYSIIPNLFLFYAVVMIGGIQHAGWSFLSVLHQGKNIVGCEDEEFFNLTQRYIYEHMLVGDLTALITLNIGLIWHFCSILSGKTYYPRWFVICSPLCVTLFTVVFGFCLPAPYAGFVLAPIGTWLLFFPTVFSTLYLWNGPIQEKNKNI